MNDDPSADPSHTYRGGYRDGFRDGYAEAAADARKLAAAAGRARNGRGGPGDERDERKDDRKGGDDNENHDQQGGDKSAGDKAGDEKKGDEKKKGEPNQDDKKEADKNEDEKNSDEKKKGKPPLWKRPLVVAIALLVLLALVIGGIVFWRHSRSHESTDDAFVDGQTSQIAAQVAGRVVRLYVADNQLVKAGDPLLEIDSRDLDARITQSRAQLANAVGQVDDANAQTAVRRANAAQADAATRQAEADLTKAAQDLARYRSVDPDAVARQQVDAALAAERSARARLDAARMSARAAHAQVEASLAQVRSGEAQVSAARAEVAASELQGSYAHVTAPIAGRVARRTVDLGNVIANGQPLMAVVSEALWVTANFKETQLERIRPGLDVEIKVDAYPDVRFRGRVDSIQRGTGAYFSTLPAENATGNYVKVVQRVPVKIVFTDDRVRDYAIGPGMSVTPSVDIP